MSTPGAKTKDNPRKAELKEALGKAKTQDGYIPGVLQDASTAMSSKAWTGGTSGDFSAGLTAHVTTAKSGGSKSVSEVQDAYDACPAEITDPTTTGPN